MQIVRANFTVRSMLAPPLFAALLLCLLLGTRALAASSPALPYRTSGSVAGTALLYSDLAIDSGGKVTIVISNPGRTGESFSARFSFYTEKGVYLTGFAVEGFASRMSSTAFALDLPDYRSVKKAAYMRVLGRSGRLGE